MKKTVMIVWISVCLVLPGYVLPASGLSADGSIVPDFAEPNGNGRLTITAGPWPPFTGRDLPFYGAAARVVSDAFALEGYRVDFLFRPWMRAYLEAKTGRVNGSILWRRTREREKHFYYSDPVLSVDIVFFHLKSVPFDWEEIEDLAGFRSGVVNGFKYGNAFDAGVASGRIPADVVASQEMNFRKLLKGRIDYTPVVRQSGYATIQTMFPPDIAGRFTHHSRVLARQKLYLILSRKIWNNARLLREFNRGLFRYHQNGRHQPDLSTAD